MEKQMIKISHTQWLASGIRRGYVIPENDGTFTLQKEAMWGAIANIGAKLLGNQYVRSALIGGGLGAITNLVGRSNLVQAAQDWWRGGNETPEMLQALQTAKGQLEQEIMPRLMGISDRLDGDLRRIQEKINERIQTFSQRLTERGLGPAFDKGQQMAMDEEEMNNMIMAAQRGPTNYDMIADKVKTTGSAPAQPAAPAQPSAPASTAPAATPTPAAPAPSAAPAAPKKPGTGGSRALDQAYSAAGKAGT